MLGYGASASNAEGSAAIGKNASVNAATSMAIGPYASVSGGTSMAIGPYASTANVGCLQLGSASYLSSITARVPITVTSDERDKADISEIGDGAVEFLKKVRAIRYVLNNRELYINNDSLSEEERQKKEKYGLCCYDREAHAKGSKKGKRVRVGVSAQNTQEALAEAYGDSSYANLVNDNLFDFPPDEIPEGVESQLAANYEGFIPFLIKAVQELDSRIWDVEEFRERSLTK